MSILHDSLKTKNVVTTGNLLKQTQTIVSSKEPNITKTQQLNQLFQQQLENEELIMLEKAKVFGFNYDYANDLFPTQECRFVGCIVFRRNFNVIIHYAIPKKFTKVSVVYDIQRLFAIASGVTQITNESKEIFSKVKKIVIFIFPFVCLFFHISDIFCFCFSRLSRV